MRWLVGVGANQDELNGSDNLKEYNKMNLESAKLFLTQCTNDSYMIGKRYSKSYWAVYSVLKRLDYTKAKMLNDYLTQKEFSLETLSDSLRKANAYRMERILKAEQELYRDQKTTKDKPAYDVTNFLEG